MAESQNIDVAQRLLDSLGGGQDPGEIGALFVHDLAFEIQGDEGVLPWIGRKTGRAALESFVRDIRALTEPLSFDVEDILASDARAAIVGALKTRITATGKVTGTQFAIILTIANGLVTRLRMLEDRRGKRNIRRGGNTHQCSFRRSVAGGALHDHAQPTCQHAYRGASSQR